MILNAVFGLIIVAVVSWAISDMVTHKKEEE
jgi:hypothetical protein